MIMGFYYGIYYEFLLWVFTMDFYYDFFFNMGFYYGFLPWVFTIGFLLWVFTITIMTF